MEIILKLLIGRIMIPEHGLSSMRAKTFAS